MRSTTGSAFAITRCGCARSCSAEHGTGARRELCDRAGPVARLSSEQISRTGRRPPCSCVHACLRSRRLSPTAPALAHGPNQPPHQSYKIGDLTLESGEVIRDFSISYVTHGTLNEKKSNAILMVTAISGNHHRLDFLIGPGKALDTNEIFHHLHRRDRQRADHLAVELHRAAAHEISEVPAPRHGDVAEEADGAPRHQPRRRGDRPVDGRHAGAAMGRQPSGFHGLAGLAGAARQDAGLDRRGARCEPQGDHARSGLEERRLRRAARAGHPAVARHSRLPVGARRRKCTATSSRTRWTCCRGCRQQETAQIKLFDANDWIYQTWAYERHDVGTTPGMNGDMVKALRAIKAKTLIMVGTKDLLNPEYEPQDAARFIRDVRTVTISPGTVTGHGGRRRRVSGRCRSSQPRDRPVLRPGDAERRQAEIGFPRMPGRVCPRARMPDSVIGDTSSVGRRALLTPELQALIAEKVAALRTEAGLAHDSRRHRRRLLRGRPRLAHHPVQQRGRAAFPPRRRRRCSGAILWDAVPAHARNRLGQLFTKTMASRETIRSETESVVFPAAAG